MLHGTTIYMNAQSSIGGAVDLLTGQIKMRVDALTGKELPWHYHRRYGCNSVIASEYLLTFRSGAAGFYDLTGEHWAGTPSFLIYSPAGRLMVQQIGAVPVSLIEKFIQQQGRPTP